MNFDPSLFINVAKELNSTAKTEESYRSVVNRAYYGAFGYLKNKLNIADYGPSSHQTLIDCFRVSFDREQRIIGKKLEALFENRRHADYKYNIEFKGHSSQYCIEEAEKIIEMFNKLNKAI